MIPLWEALRSIGVFADLSEADLQFLASEAEDRQLPDGELIAQPGDAMDYMVAIVEGALVARDERANRQRLFRAEAGEVTGYLPYSRMQRAGLTVRAAGPARMAFWHRDCVPGLLHRVPIIGSRLVAAMVDRARDTVRTDQQQEKLAALGKLSAGLAHELNNPAAAARRASEDMGRAVEALIEANVHLSQRELTVDQRAYLACVERETVHRLGSITALDPLERSDREEAMLSTLESKDVPRPWLLAGSLVDMDWHAKDVEELARKFDSEDLCRVLTRISATFLVGRLAIEIQDATSRISELVRSIKEYSFMDQAPEQEVDIHRGIESTLTMLRYRLKHGVTVHRDFDRSIPPLCVRPGELNQVWTNLIDNSIDAMSGKGDLRIRTVRETGQVLIEIEDTGSGIPDEIRNRVFDPFFTTKGPGEGTGLGLDTVFHIVRGHGGTVTFESRPGQTRFQVRLPLGQFSHDKEAETAA